MFRKPNDDDYGCGRLVKAKPIQTKYAQKLSMTGKDFVTSAFEGEHRASGPDCCAGDDVGSSRDSPLTEDERNKIHAKILKAEMKGDNEAVNKLKRKLEEGRPESEKSVVLLKRDRSGNVMPATSSKSSSESFAQSSSRMQREYGRQQGVKEMVREEKSLTAEDQLMMFHRSIIVSCLRCLVDDAAVRGQTQLAMFRCQTRPHVYRTSYILCDVHDKDIATLNTTEGSGEDETLLMARCIPSC